MKSKNGFTLVELLAVVIILAVIVLIASSSLWDAFNGGKTALSKIEKKGIQDAAETLILEVVNCDISNYLYSSIYDSLSTSNPKCSDVINYITSNSVTVTINELKENEYFEDITNRCTGEVTITTNSNYKVTVDTSNVTCGDN